MQNKKQNLKYSPVSGLESLFQSQRTYPPKNPTHHLARNIPLKRGEKKCLR